MNNQLISTQQTEEDLIHDKIYLSLWENPMYLPDPVSDAFRNSIIKTAMEICHETGDESTYVDFCVDTILTWMTFDVPKLKKEAKIL